MRLMSVSHTTAQVVAREKTVTRRLGWRFARVGDRVQLCEKVMGRRKGEEIVRICAVELVDVRRERLWLMDPADVEREGFPTWTVGDFVEFFCDAMRCAPDVEVTRIEWRYLEDNDG